MSKPLSEYLGGFFSCIVSIDFICANFIQISVRR